MDWKSTLLNNSIIFIAVLISVKLFAPAGGALEKSSETLSGQVQLLSERIERLEGLLDKVNVNLAGPQPGSSRAQGQQSRADELNQDLHAIKESLAHLENKSGAPRPVEPMLGAIPFAGPAPNAGPPVVANPTAWIGELPEDKRAKVDEIFSQHAESLRSRLPQDGPPPDPETMRRIMEESDQELKQDLKASLSDQEYQKFLKSLPKLPKVQ